MILLQAGAWPWLWLARLPRLATCLGVGRCQKTHWLGGLLISGQPLRLDSACLGLSCFTSRRFAFASLPTVCHILSLVRLWGLTFGRPSAHHQRHGTPLSIIEKVSRGLHAIPYAFARTPPGWGVLGPVRKRKRRELADFEADDGRTPCVG